MAVRSKAQTLAWARVARRGHGGLCLGWTRKALNIGPKWPSAISAWNNNTQKHPTTDLGKIPVGAPIFFTPRPGGSPYGHVAIYAGNGRMYTTDSSKPTTRLQSVAGWQRVGYRLLGYAGEVNGVNIPWIGGSGKASTSAAPGKIRVDGYWGPLTKKRWQQVLGTTVDGVISKPYSQMVAKIQQGLGLKVTGRWDRHLTLALQKRYGTTQDGKTSKPSQWVRKLQERLNRGTW